MRFTLATEYDEAAYAALAHLMIHKLRRWPRLMVILTGVLSIVVSGAVMIRESVVSPVAVLFLLLGNITLFFGLTAERVVLRMLVASNKKGEIPRFQYDFGDELVVNGAAGQKTYSYAFVRRVMETEAYLFFFMGDGQTYIVKRNGLAENEYSAFRTFLESRLAAGAREQQAGE